MDDVLARMHAIDAALPAEDGVACFNRMYLQVTESVRSQVDTGDFADPEFMARLDVVFANLYFDAVNALSVSEDDQPVAWRPLLRLRDDGEIQPLQFALAGMNVHINHDLPLAVVATCLERSTAPTDGAHHADYEKVNTILDRLEPGIRQSFEPVVVRKVDKALADIANAICDFSLNNARDLAWETTLALWEVRERELLRDLMTSSLGRAVEAGTRALLISL